MAEPLMRKPDWMKVRLPGGERVRQIERMHRDRGLHTVCRSAACPNRGECWSRGTATFMILGNRCTRACNFCNLQATPAGLAVDPLESGKVAEAVAELELRHAVITSVTRDDLADFGAGQFVAVVEAIRSRTPECRVELLIPDFAGEMGPLEQVLAAGPDILGHNLETVPRLYPLARSGARYERSLELLERVAAYRPTIPAKSGLMVGLGEKVEELEKVFADLAFAGCSMLTIGQYLAPTRQHLPVVRYYEPDEFDDLATLARSAGISQVMAGPLVRSSYLAEEQLAERASAINAVND